MSWKHDRDGRAGPDLRLDGHPAAEVAGALLHADKAEAVWAARGARVESGAVVGHCQDERRRPVDRDADGAGAAVVDRIRHGLAQDPDERLADVGGRVDAWTHDDHDLDPRADADAVRG